MIDLLILVLIVCLIAGVLWFLIGAAPASMGPFKQIAQYAVLVIAVLVMLFAVLRAVRSEGIDLGMAQPVIGLLG